MTSIYVEGREIKPFPKQPNSYSEIRIQKILDYAKRHSKRSDTKKGADFEGLNEEQEKWSKTRLAGPDWTCQFGDDRNVK